MISSVPEIFLLSVHERKNKQTEKKIKHPLSNKQCLIFPEINLTAEWLNHTLVIWNHLKASSSIWVKLQLNLRRSIQICRIRHSVSWILILLPTFLGRLVNRSDIAFSTSLGHALWPFEREREKKRWLFFSHSIHRGYYILRPRCCQY